MLIAASENSFSPLCTMASNTGWVSVSELLMTFSTSDGRSLLLQRFGHFRSARLHLLEQPHVLDRDHSLVGEGL